MWSARSVLGVSFESSEFRTVDNHSESVFSFCNFIFFTLCRFTLTSQISHFYLNSVPKFSTHSENSHLAVLQPPQCAQVSAHSPQCKSTSCPKRMCFQGQHLVCSEWTSALIGSFILLVCLPSASRFSISLQFSLTT